MAANGCAERKCPCRLLVNCFNYIDMQRQVWRLKKKEYDFDDWYRDNFRQDLECTDLCGSG